MTTTAAARRTGGAAPSEPGLFDPVLRRLVVVVTLGAIMSILDTTIVNVAIDKLAEDFHASLSTIQWVSTGYLLALSMVIPLTGWSIERFGAKKMWVLSLVFFLAGSALSGAAWSAGSLIAFRVVQGVGGGMIMPIGQSMLAQQAGPQRMGRVMSVLGVPMLLGPVLGPVIGGLIVDQWSWRWIFYVNLPIGAVALYLAVRLLPRTEGHRTRPLDTVGLVLLSPALAGLVYGLAQAGNEGTTAEIWLPIGIGAVLAVAFVLHSLRAEEPLLDVRLFRDKVFTASAATGFGFGAGLFGAMLLLPLYYQVVRGQSALTAGAMMAPQGIGAALMMPLAGKLTDRHGARVIVIPGLLLAALGTVVYTHVGPSTSYWALGISLFVRGLGFGCVMMPAMAAAYQTLRRDQVPRATTAVNIIQRIGGSVGVALLAVVLQRQIAAHVAGLHGGFTGQKIPEAVRHQVAGPLATAFGHSFWWALALLLVAVLPALLLPGRASRTTPAQAQELAEVPGAEPVLAFEG